MPPKKRAIKPNEVRVYKDDGVWWAEVDDPVWSARATFSQSASDFISRVESMVLWIDVDPQEIEWVTEDSAAKKFLNRARKLHANGGQSNQDDTTEEELDEHSADVESNDESLSGS